VPKVGFLRSGSEDPKVRCASSARTSSAGCRMHAQSGRPVGANPAGRPEPQTGGVVRGPRDDHQAQDEDQGLRLRHQVQDGRRHADQAGRRPEPSGGAAATERGAGRRPGGGAADDQHREVLGRRRPLARAEEASDRGIDPQRLRDPPTEASEAGLRRSETAAESPALGSRPTSPTRMPRARSAARR
jgi:hypothetical protein